MIANIKLIESKCEVLVHVVYRLCTQVDLKYFYMSCSLCWFFQQVCTAHRLHKVQLQASGYRGR